MVDRAAELSRALEARRTMPQGAPAPAQTFTVSTADQITMLRMLLGEKIPVGGSDADTLFLDAELDSVLIQFSTVSMALAVGWAAKAGKLSGLVDVEESGSKRRLQQKFANAQRMADFYAKQAGADQDAISKAVRVVGVAVNPYATKRKPVTVSSIVEKQAGGLWISYEPAAAGQTVGTDDPTATVEPNTHGITLDIERNRTFRMGINVPSMGLFVDGRMQIKATPSDALPAWDGTVASGGITVAGAVISVLMTPADTAALALSRGVFELIGTLDNGDVVSVANGYVNVTAGIVA